MTKKNQQVRMNDAADFDDDADEDIFDEVGDDVSAEDEIEIFDEPEDELESLGTVEVAPEQIHEADLTQVTANPPLVGSVLFESDLATPEAAATMALIERAEASDEADDWNAVADRLYQLEHLKHTRAGLQASRLGRLLERLP